MDIDTRTRSQLTSSSYSLKIAYLPTYWAYYQVNWYLRPEPNSKSFANIHLAALPTIYIVFKILLNLISSVHIPISISRKFQSNPVKFSEFEHCITSESLPNTDLWLANEMRKLSSAVDFKSSILSSIECKHSLIRNIYHTT